MRKTLHTALLVFSLSYLVSGQSDSQRGPSTEEERKRFIEVTRKLEQDPLDDRMRADRSWALKWLEDVPDINVNMCVPVMGDLGRSRYRYAPQLGAQFGLEMAVFLIEHPNQSGDLNAQYMAGLQGALRAYKSILKTEPMAVSAQMEALINLQDKGKLEEYVRERAKECPSGDRAT
ncbi:MAG TPA: hypothetical protein VF532_01485 [Candidatus Angelobacter sp.]